ncbi:unnamed protein product [Soboliphyme baturini]|uniref:Uncharacterized protein n=1 Tax=Soboliphyme baturini TaxID=241478 RepID=A0A183I9S2_9BILA|nr:unnamed protein product [Soboliphyme baturini]
MIDVSGHVKNFAAGFTAHWRLDSPAYRPTDTVRAGGVGTTARAAIAFVEGGHRRSATNQRRCGVEALPRARGLRIVWLGAKKGGALLTKPADLCTWSYDGRVGSTWL